MLKDSYLVIKAITCYYTTLVSVTVFSVNPFSS